MRFRKFVCILGIVAGCLLPSCHDVPEQPNDPRGNFEALWTIINEHYCFLREKDLDWNAVHEEFSSKVSPSMNREQLFNLCAEMLNRLKDGHVNLVSFFATSYYQKWWTDYPQNYNERLIEQYYFNFQLRHIGSSTFGILPQNIGYWRYPSFVSSLGRGNIDAILAEMLQADGLIIDIRDNGGGGMDNVETLVGPFIRQPRTLAGYISHKNGPGHGDFSEPYAYYYNPVGDGHLQWRKPVVVLTNRSTFSAANNFVSIMQYLPDTYIVGATTGGGSGMPYSSELPNGWGVRFSACSVLDCRGQVTEFGIEPSPGCAVDMDPQAALEGRDTMLDFAVGLLQNLPLVQ